MPDKSHEFRDQLLDAQEANPALREACYKKLDATLNHTLTPRNRLLMLPLLLALVAFAGLGIHTMLFFYRGPLLYGVWILFTAICAISAVGVVRTLWKGRLAWKSYYPVADIFVVAAAAITVLMLLLGLHAPADPASTFGTLYALVFLVVCIAWSTRNRIASAELVAREQMLRIEYRLVDLADRLNK